MGRSGKCAMYALKDLGYEKVELISTDSGKFMSAWEAKWMGLGGSAILTGKK